MDDNVLDLEGLRAEWKELEASMAVARDRRRAEFETFLGKKLPIARSAFALCNRAVEAAFAHKLSKADRAKSELVVWTLARAVDAFYHLTAGDAAAGMVLYRAALEGHAVLAAMILDGTVADRFANFEFIGQAEARKIVDPTHREYRGEVPPEFKGQEGANILGSVYDYHSKMAHPTRFAAFLQTVPELVNVEQAAAVGRTRVWTLGTVNWPTLTDGILPSLVLRVLSLVDAMIPLPLDHRERDKLIMKKRVIEKEVRELWSIPSDAP